MAPWPAHGEQDDPGRPGRDDRRDDQPSAVASPVATTAPTTAHAAASNSAPRPARPDLSGAAGPRPVGTTVVTTSFRSQGVGGTTAQASGRGDHPASAATATTMVAASPSEPGGTTGSAAVP